MSSEDILSRITESCKRQQGLADIQFFLANPQTAQCKLLYQGPTSQLYHVTSQDGTQSFNYLLYHGNQTSGVVYPPQVCLTEGAVGLQKLCDVAPEAVLKPLAVDVQGNAAFLEGASGFSPLGQQITDCEDTIIDKVAIHKLGQLLGHLHKSSHVETVGEQALLQFKNRDASKLNWVQRFQFAGPFNPNETSNEMTEDVRAKIVKVWQNPEVQNAVQHLAQLFQSKTECVVHGNLSPYSVLAKGGNVKIFGGEFVQVGPCSYDVGVLLAHYMIAYHQHMLTPENNDDHRQVSYKMTEAINRTVEGYLDTMTCGGGDRETYSQQLVSEAAGFAGIEIMARVMGAFHIPALQTRPSIEVECLETAVRLLSRHSRITNPGMMLKIGLMW